MEDTTFQDTLQNLSLDMQTASLLEVVAKYFVDHPGCVATRFSPEEAEQFKLYDLEKHCTNPHNWYEAVEHLEYNGDGTLSRTFYLQDFSVLEKHGFCDTDAVKVYITTSTSQILELEQECD